MSAFLKMDSIKQGESMAKGHEGSKGWIEIGTFSFSSGRSISSPTGHSGKREASAPTVSEVQITKLQDSTSPLLFQESLVGKPTNVEIDLVETGTSQLEIYCKILLTNAIVSAYNVSSSGDRPTESISLNFTKIEYDYQGYDDSGKAASDKKQTVIYDLATATKQ